jgi:4a-hydroxytetrahydrobiopterin dehydratase
VSASRPAATDCDREAAAEWEPGTIVIWVAYVRHHMTNLLSDDEIETQLPDDWNREGDEIVRVYEFDDYLRGVNFAQMVGEIAEAQFHHPEIIIRYAGVEIRLTSHEEGGITDDDIEMAELIESERGD